MQVKCLLLLYKGEGGLHTSVDNPKEALRELRRAQRDSIAKRPKKTTVNFCASTRLHVGFNGFSQLCARFSKIDGRSACHSVANACRVLQTMGSDEFELENLEIGHP